MKLANSLKNKTTHIFLTAIFKYGLQPYQHVTTTSMKRKTLEEQKEVALVCEEGIFEVEAINNLFVP